MSKPGKNFRRGKKNTLYHFIGELIQEGKYAWFVNREGRFRIKWDNAVERYIEYRAKKNPSYDLNIDRKRASNSFREGLLRRYRDDADGAKEYEECQKVGENKKIVEREFQMPSEVFHSLFGTSEELSGDQMSPKVFQSPFGSEVELSVNSNHETSGCASTSSEVNDTNPWRTQVYLGQVDEKLQVFPDSGISDASDTGFEEAMDVSDAPQGNNKREDPFDPTNIATSDEIFHFSDEELLHLVLEDISTHSDSDVNQPEVVQDISPSSGSVKGGTRFHIMLKEALPESDTTVVANFDGIGEVFLAKTNPYTFSGTAPAAKEAGPVLITVYTGAGRKLGVTCFLYVDEMSEALKQLIKHPDLRSLFITMYQEYGIIGSNSNVVQTLGQFSLPDQGSLADAKQLPSLKVLQLLVYTAAHEGAQQLLEIIFSTSAGKIVFDSYKDRTPLPEDVARANGHDELAKFLQDLNERFSNASDSNSVSLGSSDWLELVQALDDIQKQTVFTTVSSDEQESSRMQPWDDDDQSDYFADAETSSCGSLEFNGDWSDLEEENGACTEDEDCKNATIETGNDNCASLRHYPHEEHLRTSLGFSEENAATKESFEDETQSGNFQHSIIQLVPVISPSSGSVKIPKISYISVEDLYPALEEICTNSDNGMDQTGGSFADAKQLQSLKVLQLLVYNAAQKDTQQFLEMIFSTSAGKIVFDSYKDRTPLPEDVARANGHDKLTKFLQDVNKRLSNETDRNSVSLGSSDWLELVQALDNIQREAVLTTFFNDEQESSRMQPKDDDNQSDYFADAKTSSCGSREFNGDWSDLEEENGACTEDEDCKNATIETGNDNCASLRHYPHEESLRTSLAFSEENAATKESFEDETQSGNFQHSIIQLVPVISPLSGSVKVIYAATKESFEDETQSGNFQHSIIQLVPVISPSSGSVKREREGMELYPAQINFLPEDEKQQVIRDLKTKAENIEESFLETAKKLVDVCPIYRVVCVAAASPLSVTGFSIGSAGATSNSGTATVDSHANSAEMKKAEKQLTKIRESINEKERDRMKLNREDIINKINFDLQQVRRDLKEVIWNFREAAKILNDMWCDFKIAHNVVTSFGRLEAHVLSMGGRVATLTTAGAASPLSVTGFSIGSAGATSNSGTATVDSHANSAEMKKAEKQLAKIRESINEVHTIVQKVLRVK